MARRSYVPTGIKQKANGSSSVYEEKRFFDYGGGLNNKYAPERIGDSQASDLLNVNFDQYPAMQSRKGYVPFNNKIDNNPIQSIFPYYKTDGSKSLIAVSGNSVYEIGYANQTWNVLSNETFNELSLSWNFVTNGWNAIHTGLKGNNVRFTFAVYNDILYMVNGVDGLMKWDGDSFSFVSNAPNGKYIILHKNYMFIAGDPANPNYLYFSDLGNVESWPGLNVIAEFTNDGDGLTGLAEFKDMLIVFKEKSKFLLKGSGAAYYTNVGPVGLGTVSHHSVVAIPASSSEGKVDLLMFLSRDGVYAFDGVHDHLMSDLIQGSVNQWNQQYLSGAVAVDYGHKYWLSVPEGSTVISNNITYIFDYIHHAWSKYNIAASSFCVYQDATTLQPQLCSGDVAQGVVYHQDTGSTDNGNQIDAYYVTKQYDLGNPAHFKRFKGLFLFAPTAMQNYNISVTYNVDFGKQVSTVSLPLQESTTQWGSGVYGESVWGGAANIATKTTNIPGMGRYISFKIENNASNQPWAFYGMVIRFKTKARMA